MRSYRCDVEQGDHLATVWLHERAAVVGATVALRGRRGWWRVALVHRDMVIDSDAELPEDVPSLTLLPSPNFGVSR